MTGQAAPDPVVFGTWPAGRSPVDEDDPDGGGHERDPHGLLFFTRGRAEAAGLAPYHWYSTPGGDGPGPAFPAG